MKHKNHYPLIIAAAKAGYGHQVSQEIYSRRKVARLVVNPRTGVIFHVMYVVEVNHYVYDDINAPLLIVANLAEEQAKANYSYSCNKMCRQGFNILQRNII